jgi:hypothetical protein
MISAWRVLVWRVCGRYVELFFKALVSPKDKALKDKVAAEDAEMEVEEIVHFRKMAYAKCVICVWLLLLSLFVVVWTHLRSILRGVAWRGVAWRGVGWGVRGERFSSVVSVSAV